MINQNFTQEQVNTIVNFAISNNVEFDTPEKFKALMDRWIKSELTFFDKFDKLSFTEKKDILGLKFNPYPAELG